LFPSPFQAFYFLLVIDFVGSKLFGEHDQLFFWHDDFVGTVFVVLELLIDFVGFALGVAVLGLAGTSEPEADKCVVQETELDVGVALRFGATPVIGIGHC
jgi:hypothetical protein